MAPGTNRGLCLGGRHRRFYRSIYPRRRIFVCPWQYSLVGQSFSALGASSLQDVSAVSGSHSLSETVFLGTLSLLGLVRSQHLYSLLFHDTYDVTLYYKHKSPVL